MDGALGGRLKIGVDIDGVLADIVDCILPLLSRELGRAVDVEEITVYGFGDALGIPEDRVQALLDELLVVGLYEQAPPVAGAREAMELLGGHDVWLVTSRPEAVREATLWWLRHHGVAYGQLVFAPAHRKALADDGFDLFVEDNLDTALALSREGIHVLLFDRPWNRNADLPANVRRVHNWTGILDFVERQLCASRS